MPVPPRTRSLNINRYRCKILTQRVQVPLGTVIERLRQMERVRCRFTSLCLGTASFLPVAIYPDRTAAAFTQQLASLLLEVGQQLTPLHTAMVISSAAGSFLRCCSLSVSSKSRTAALRSARHSSFVSPCPLAPGISRQVAQKPPSSASPGCTIAVSVVTRSS